MNESSPLIAVSGASGFIGSALCEFLEKTGKRVKRLVRRKPTNDAEVYWNPNDKEIDHAGLEGLDAVVHLAGKNIFAPRWTESFKAAIFNSRVEGTRFLCEALAGLERRPATLVSASAIGFYGNRGDEPLDESSAGGEGFLPTLVRQWESATAAAEEAGIRVAQTRFGAVLHPDGGALKLMLPAFRLGLGGRLGDGRQFFGWVSRLDAVKAIDIILGDESLSGPVNVVSPTPVRNAELTEALARKLHRPALLPVPACALRLLMGEMAEDVLLAGVRAEPGKLKAAGFYFQHPDLTTAFEDML